MPEVYYSVEPYTGDIIQHAGVPGMKWGWTKDGKRTGAKEAMTEQERAQRRKELLAKVGKGLGIAAGIAGAALAIRNRKKIGGAIQKAREAIGKRRAGSNMKLMERIASGKTTRLDNARSAISGLTSRIGEGAGKVRRAIGNRATKAGNYAIPKLNYAGRKATDAVGGLFGNAKNKVGGAIQKAREAIGKRRAGSNMKLMERIASGKTTRLDNARSAISGLTSRIGEGAGKVRRAIGNRATKAGNYAIPKLNYARRKVVSGARKFLRV